MMDLMYQMKKNQFQKYGELSSNWSQYRAREFEDAVDSSSDVRGSQATLKKRRVDPAVAQVEFDIRSFSQMSVDEKK